MQLAPGSTEYQRALSGPPGASHVAFIRSYGYRGPIPSQQSASRLATAILLALTETGRDTQEGNNGPR